MEPANPPMILVIATDITGRQRSMECATPKVSVAANTLACMGDPELQQKLQTALGGRTAKVVERAFGFTTVGDLLSHYPRRYAHRGELTSLMRLPINENVTLVADVLEVRNRKMATRRGSIFEVKISDGAGIITLTFFNQDWRANELKPGVRGIFAGKITEYRNTLQLAHPDYELFTEDDGARSDADTRAWAEKPIPIYPATASFPSWKIAKSISLVLDGLAAIADPIPDEIRSTEGLLDFRDALEMIHRPQKDSQARAARKTLRFHEAFVLQTALLRHRFEARSEHAVSRTAETGGHVDRFEASLPFTLTDDQVSVGEQISRDIEASAPMNRLVQGEVGSGKTLVALRAMLAVADSGGQSALLAPTEVLASQHLRSITAALTPDQAAELMPVLLTGQMTAADRKRALLRIVSGQAKIVVGTHALLSETVSFYDLGLVVIDEQHRFGVEQRDTLRRKGVSAPHVLVLTATPIPRTVAMTVFGDLDISTIRQLPKGRAGIESFVVPLADKPGWMPRVWQRVSEEISQGRQVFVVCPAIDARPSPDDAENAEGAVPESIETSGPAIERSTVVSVHESLSTNPSLSSVTSAMLHGRMSSEEKDIVMRRFAAGEIDMLVATTVIEVGVDVPNASTMVVLDADRFGVSQLHQLRGRVGRGEHAGLCLLVTAAEQETTARERVEAVAATLDGFELAQKDLELRREGDVLGNVQSGGRSSLRLLRVTTDGDLILRARELAEGLLDADPILVQHPALIDALERRLDDSEREALAKN